MQFILIKLVISAFLINLAWEVLHSRLYTTCLEMDFFRYRRAMLIMSAKDSAIIAVFYIVTVVIFKGGAILDNFYQMLLFIALGLAFSFLDERISLKRKRWQYAPAMPKVFGVGLTPLAEIAVTGLLAFYFIFS